MNFKKNISETAPGFQMAPMLDIVFILLIHFMAATLYAKWENKLDVNVPTADAKASTARSRLEIIINIDKDGAIFINSIEMSAERLQEILAAVRSRNAEQPVIIRADELTHHKDVIRVLEICARLDIHNVAFAIIKSENREARE